MLEEKDLLKVMNSYNLNSSKIGPSLYKNDNNLGICLDIKDSLFGYLTRTFIFKTKEEATDFLNKYTWYNHNHNTYNITLSLDNYETSTPQIKYTYKNQELTFNDMLNLKENIKKNEEEQIATEEKNIYLANIENLTTYLINLKIAKDNIKKEKNNLKITENNLKSSLLENLTIYYGKEKKDYNRAVSLESIIENNDISLLKNNATNIKTKSLDEIKSYLETLINIIKNEELDDKYLINIYSNNIYKYNIEILNKQIDFVKTKIASEKNFNLKGSKIHNIDEELKSFLKNNPLPTKVDVFLKDEKEKITTKYHNLNDIKNAYSIISGNNLNVTISNKNKEDISPLTIDADFNALDNNTKASLILYNSFYKDIVNYIITNNFPDITTIKNNYDLTYLYQDFQNIIYNENNSHYLINYFHIINFKTLDTFIESLINISKIITTTSFKINNNLKVFTLNKKRPYIECSLTPLYSKEKTYLVELPSNTEILYIPLKIELDDETAELTTTNTKTIYLKTNIIETINRIIVNKYDKVQQKDIKSAIIITTDLKKTCTTCFNISELEVKND